MAHRILTRSFVATSAWLASGPITTYAHPGHGTHPADSASHYLSDPWHAGSLLVALVCAAGMIALGANKILAKS